MNLRLLISGSSREKLATLADQGVVSGTNFILSLVYARILGLEEYGGFALAWMAVLFASSFQQAFIFNPMTYLYTSFTHPEKKEQYIRNLFFVNLIFSLLSSAFMALLAFSADWFSLSGDWSKHLNVLPLVTFSYLSYDFIRKYFLISNRSILTLWMDMSQSALLAVLILLLYYGQRCHTTAFLQVMSFSYACISLATMLWIGFYPKLHLSYKLLVNHWEYGKWLLATAVMQWLSGNYFILAAGSLLGIKEIGIIRIAQNIVGVLNIFFIAMETYAPVSAAKIFHINGSKALFQYLKQFTLKGLLLTIVFCVGIAIAAEPILELLYGKSYIAYAGVVQIFALFYILVFLSIPLRFTIRTLADNHHIFIGYLLSASFGFFSATLLIKTYGIYGVLAGIVMSQLLTQAWYIWALKKHFYEHYTLRPWKS